MTRPTYTGRGLWPVALMLAASALYACAADASEPDPSRPWEICIPVTTAQAAAFAAANPPTFQGTRSTPPVWIGAGGGGGGSGGTRRPLPVDPELDVPDVPPIPLPAALWLLLSALGALWVARRWAR